MLRLKKKKSHKLSPPWEGPFVISKALLNGSYYHVDIREKKDKDKPKARKHKCDDSSSEDEFEESNHPWNIAQLRPFYT